MARRRGATGGVGGAIAPPLKYGEKKKKRGKKEGGKGKGEEKEGKEKEEKEKEHV